jgi:hypothetical protein
MKPKKIYDKQTKRWVHPDTVTTLKKKDTCRGGREHDWVLVLPRDKEFKEKVSADAIKRYYELCDEEYHFRENLNKEIDLLGIKSCYYTFGLWKKQRHYICATCGKTEDRDE